MYYCCCYYDYLKTDSSKNNVCCTNESVYQHTKYFIFAYIVLKIILITICCILICRLPTLTWVLSTDYNSAWCGIGRQQLSEHEPGPIGIINPYIAEGSPSSRRDPPFYREDGDPGSPFIPWEWGPGIPILTGSPKFYDTGPSLVTGSLCVPVLTPSALWKNQVKMTSIHCCTFSLWCIA